MQKRFNISNDLSGSTIYYSISFIDVDFGVMCGSTNVSASSCMEGMCEHTYSFCSYACLNSENIIVNVLATNVLGSGSPYNITVGKNCLGVKLG